MVSVIGIDHIYISVSCMNRSIEFYDQFMKILGFRKSHFALNNDDHVHYYNKYFGYVIRPALNREKFNPLNPGLHHFCFRVNEEKEVVEIASKLKQINIEVSEPKMYPEYAPDYFAIFVNDPDGIELEITNYRKERQLRYENWDS